MGPAGCNQQEVHSFELCTRRDARTRHTHATQARLIRRNALRVLPIDAHVACVAYIVRLFGMAKCTFIVDEQQQQPSTGQFINSHNISPSCAHARSAPNRLHYDYQPSSSSDPPTVPCIALHPVIQSIAPPIRTRTITERTTTAFPCAAQFARLPSFIHSPALHTHTHTHTAVRCRLHNRARPRTHSHSNAAYAHT